MFKTRTLLWGCSVFKPNWQARIAAGPWSVLVSMAAILILIGFIGLAGISYR